jgi:2-keto-4-pentenoate hydratase/2-oxohepta-3-ene-1,7-dioic acid hydratase in catechol pathway
VRPSSCVLPSSCAVPALIASRTCVTGSGGVDTFCPLGPVIDTELDLAHGTIETSVNGERRQEGRLADMVHSIGTIVAYASSVFTLLPGDVILTGTPSGVGPIVDGETVEVTVSGLGTLSNPVRAAR